ncbi:MAG: Integrase core domain protein [Chloroflexi bacterium ADurb.Bin222]|nr:MAG: Integrase core domain protein [Chloroflexi bacterium ADurb.Bin222]
MKELTEGKPLSEAAMKAGIDPKTARKYRDGGALPSANEHRHDWRTRTDPFEDVWDEVVALLKVNAGLQANTLFAELQRRHPGRFQDGQLRTLQRKVKVWRALEGPAKEVFFAQEHHPGDLCASDFCHLTSLGITLQGQPFSHLLYHFVLTYSNWETGMVCPSESFESLSAGLQRALWQLSGVPRRHRTDSLSAAVQPLDHPDEFRQRYEALLKHYGIEAEHIQRGEAHENGDVEHRHYRFRQAVGQALMLRGSHDFDSRREYDDFLRRLFAQLNAGRLGRLKEELALLKPLPATTLDHRRLIRVGVGGGSTIRVLFNTYSVPSTLIGEEVEVRVDAEELQVWYAGRCMARMPRLRGRGHARIDYRHVIDWLVRKPGAFANYRYREELFPTTRFRIAYDALRSTQPLIADKEYLKILALSAKESETGVDDVLRHLLQTGETVSAACVEEMLRQGQQIPPATAVEVAPVDLGAYDSLLTPTEVA